MPETTNAIEFTFQAPVEYLDTTGTSLKTVTSSYKGLSKIWARVNASTNYLETFVSDGELDKPLDTDEAYHVLLDASNPDHILVMDLLRGGKDHPKGEDLVEVIIPEGTFSFPYSMSYVRPLNQNSVHTYERNETKVSKDGKTITYQWKKPHIDSETINRVLTSRIEETKQMVALVTLPNLSLRYQRLLEILLYIQSNLKTVSPWKINLPIIEDM